MISSNGGGASLPRLNLPEIERALIGVCEAVESNPKLWRKLRREEMNADVIRRLIEGYCYVDRLLAEDVDLFAYGASEQILELNHLVLCGTSTQTREAAKKHIEETGRFFYAVRAGGVGSFIDWYQQQRGQAPQRLAAGIFMQIVSGPQLFIEGNQRTGTLIASYALARLGCGPFVLTPETYRSAFGVFAEVKATNRLSLRHVLRAWRLKKAVSDLMEPKDLKMFLNTGNADLAPS